MNSNPPLFSIVTVTLNNETGLRETYQSIQNQSFTDYEWIPVDGGSKDGSVDFLRSLRSNARAKLENFNFISEADNGIYDAMNKGMKEAKGQYIIFMNAGDLFANEKSLETIAKQTEKQPDFIYGDALEKPEKDGKAIIKPARRYKDIPWGMFTHHQAMIYSNAHIHAQKMHYSQLYDIASDYDFTARFLSSAKKIIYIPAPICIFKEGGVSQQQAFKGRREQFIIREKLKMVGTPENLWIFCVQSLVHSLKSASPSFYRFLKAFLIKKQ